MENKSSLLAPSSPGPVQDDTPVLTANQVGEMTRQITSGFVNSLRGLSSLDSKEQCSLIVPANVLLYLGSLLVLVSFALRIVPAHFLSSFQLGDFVSSLAAGSFLLSLGAFLFWFQYRTEQGKSTGTLKAAERVASEGLVATLGAVRPAAPAKTFTP